MIVLRPNEFHRDQKPDYDVVWNDPDGRDKAVGRIFHNPNGTMRGGPEWWWGVDFFQRNRRQGPHSGRAVDLDSAKTQWRRCWDSAEVPIRW